MANSPTTAGIENDTQHTKGTHHATTGIENDTQQ